MVLGIALHKASPLVEYSTSRPSLIHLTYAQSSKTFCWLHDSESEVYKALGPRGKAASAAREREGVRASGSERRPGRARGGGMRERTRGKRGRERERATTVRVRVAESRRTRRG
ncbi:hypothetical protein ILYODFUR_003684 [Ilyodon furcidens]|uniref:Uncharacterized protein n=1 Tax=Ilyodon furcidens TaxID=33524 RepID=A0ABV0TGZ0_9TELE